MALKLRPISGVIWSHSQLSPCSSLWLRLPFILSLIYVLIWGCVYGWAYGWFNYVMIDSFKDVLQPDDTIIHLYGYLWLVSCYHSWKNSMPLLFIADWTVNRINNENINREHSQRKHLLFCIKVIFCIIYLPLFQK